MVAFTPAAGTLKQLIAMSLLARIYKRQQLMNRECMIGAVFVVCRGIRDNGDGM